ncbi:MAG TPA: hypothetical protein VNF45_03720 [Candidatus Binataceae bacterium]|nr:hypothetical protein [Candidatus Binataceae bacterium]
MDCYSNEEFSSERVARVTLDAGSRKSEARFENAIASMTSPTKTTPKEQEDDAVSEEQIEEAEQDASDPTHEKEIPPDK